MPIRQRIPKAPEKAKRQRKEYFEYPDLTKWSNEELAVWLEGRAYEVAGKAELAGYRKVEYDTYLEAARRLRR